MKDLSSIAKGFLPTSEDKDILCDYVTTPWGSTLLDSPILSKSYECQYCSGKACYTPFFDPKISNKRVWLCANLKCEVYNAVKDAKPSVDMPKPKRCLEWVSFCEINGIGNKKHDVKFDKILQSSGKLEFLLKFVQKPEGIILMKGSPGTGKSYMALGACELFTRKSGSCIFTTQKNLHHEWLQTFKNEKNSNFIHKVTNYSLLVIDDFGTGEISTGFMTFFMDLINTRMEWDNRGTIITTNLNDKDFSSYCGDALSDRMNTGQTFEFTGETRRNNVIL